MCVGGWGSMSYHAVHWEVRGQLLAVGTTLVTRWILGNELRLLTWWQELLLC